MAVLHCPHCKGQRTFDHIQTLQNEHGRYTTSYKCTACGFTVTRSRGDMLHVPRNNQQKYIPCPHCNGTGKLPAPKHEPLGYG